MSRFDFFNRGCTMADLNVFGTIPEESDLLKMSKMSVDKNRETSFKNAVGRASAGEEEDFMLLIIFKRSS